MKSSEVLKATAILGALVWGVWSLVPVVVAVLVSFVAIAYYGASVFTVPAWALGIGAASVVLTGSIYFLLRDDMRAVLAQKIWFFAKIGAVFFMATGALAAVMANLPPAPPIDPEALTPQLDGNLNRVATGVTTFYAWLVMVVMPAVLGALSVYLVVSVDPTSGSGATES